MLISVEMRKLKKKPVIQVPVLSSNTFLTKPPFSMGEISSLDCSSCSCRLTIAASAPVILHKNVGFVENIAIVGGDTTGGGVQD